MADVLLMVQPFNHEWRKIRNRDKPLPVFVSYSYRGIQLWWQMAFLKHETNAFRFAENIFGWLMHQQSSLMNHCDRIGHSLYVIDRVTGENYGAIPLGYRSQDSVAKLFPGNRIEARHRLIK